MTLCDICKTRLCSLNEFKFKNNIYCYSCYYNLKIGKTKKWIMDEIDGKIKKVQK